VTPRARGADKSPSDLGPPRDLSAPIRARDHHSRTCIAALLVERDAVTSNRALTSPHARDERTNLRQTSDLTAICPPRSARATPQSQTSILRASAPPCFSQSQGRAAAWWPHHERSEG